MAYRVSIAARAARDLISLYDRINAEESAAALRWYQGLKRAILSLEEHPSRGSTTPERKQLRHLLYGRKPHVDRAIYKILETKKQVEVLHVRYGPRRRFRIDDLR